MHPDDKLVAWFPKIITLATFTFCEMAVLMLPLDVANTSLNGSLPMDVLWEIVFLVMVILALGVLPFTMFYYEADEEKGSIISQALKGLKAVFITCFAFLIIYFLLWVFIGVIDVNVASLSFGAHEATVTIDSNNVTHINYKDTSVLTTACSGLTMCDKVTEAVTFRVSPVLFLVTIFSLIGHCLLALFGGIGMAALPWDLITGYKNRPKKIRKDEYESGKKAIAGRCLKLIELGDQIKANRKVVGVANKKNRDKFATFRQSVLILDADYRRLDESYNISGKTIILAHVKLLVGLISIAISILWFLQIILYLPLRDYIANPLGAIIQALDTAWGFMGAVSYGVVVFYLLVCVLKGIIKCGMRLLIIPLYPMEKDNTTMSAFIFNGLLFVISTFTVIHFSTTALSSYVDQTAISNFFTLSVNGIRGLRYFFYYVPFVLAGMPILAIILLSLLPKEVPAIEIDSNLALFKKK
eukprot:TRINITY_DN2582_c0_g1_i1.p1 TRINITY_DN2582_c0_g1~~TRINITY_DN2582_c0_g1_i1.p1  ORF type:complete len:504 (-),score=122.11 TRINITY_DN2582_c0_g1_i1:73-1482(-)